jgi:hypothetical protein
LEPTTHRPNVLYCDKTGKYVLWFFCIGTTEPEYPAAMLAVAVADASAGPFKFVGQRNTAEEHGWGQDLGLFKDQDGKGYLVSKARLYPPDGRQPHRRTCRSNFHRDLWSPWGSGHRLSPPTPCRSQSPRCDRLVLAAVQGVK